jgi:Formyl transferase
VLRTIFIGYDNRLNHCVARRISQESALVGTVWLTADARWHRSWRGRREFLLKRLRRRGLLKAIDEMAYYAFHHATDKRSHNTREANRLVDAYWSALDRDVADSGTSIGAANVNDPAVLEYVAKLKPDVIFAHCLNQFFGKLIRNVAPHGIFMWHVGITPEYKGLYSPFWTMYNRDFDNFGYSLIQLTDDLDGGAVYAQGRIHNVDVRRDNHVLIEHKAILASLNDLGQFLNAIERGSARPIVRPDAVEGYYSYPGLTDYIVQRWRVRRLARGSHPQ